MNKIVKIFFTEYAKSFTNGDALEIIDFYTYPCCIRYQDHNHLYLKEDFKDNISKLCEYYKNRNMQKAVFTIKKIIHIESIIQANIIWQLFNDKGKIFSDFQCIYQLVMIENNPKIFNVININENIMLAGN